MRRIVEVRLLWGTTVIGLRTLEGRRASLPVGRLYRFEGGNDVAYELRVHEVDVAARSRRFELAPLLSTAVSVLIHACVMVALATFVADEEGTHRDRLLTMQRLLTSANAQPGREPSHLDDDMRDDSGHTEGGTGSVASGPEGKMGRPTAEHAFTRFSVEEPSRQQTLDEAATFGMAGLLEARSVTPAVSWARADQPSPSGNMWGDRIGDAFGAAGLDLSGTGEGGGGRGGGIGIGRVGTVGRGLGTGIGGGVGSGRGHPEGGHTVGPPFIREGSTTVPGRLPPETIQRIVRQSFGRFRACYEEGLRDRPSLEGRVVVKFVIERDGSVGGAEDGGSDIAGPTRDCVIRQFASLSFPEPANGVVTVIYPLVLTPTD